MLWCVPAREQLQDGVEPQSLRTVEMEKKVGVEITRAGKAATVSFTGDSISDVEAIAAMSEQIGEFIGRVCPKTMIFDFSGVKFFSSQVLGLLLETRGKLGACDGQVVISALNPQLHRVFRITNLDRIFEFFPDKETALKATGSKNAS